MLLLIHLAGCCSLNSNLYRKGQAQHLFNDALPGLIFVVLGVIILSYLSGAQAEKISSHTNDLLLQSYGERQLLSFLQTPLSAYGGQEIFSLLLDASPASLGTSSESRARSYQDLVDATRPVQSIAPPYFDSLFQPGLWYLLIHYEDLPYIAVGSASTLSRECVVGVSGKEYTAFMRLPAKRNVTLSLHYCIRGAR